MNVAEYIVKVLGNIGVKDAFGIPGGVILPFIYAIEGSDEISAHLTYHEQSAGFAACGYAQASGRPSVAYATKGPGISNLFTCIAEAFQESLPVFFITAHTDRQNAEDACLSVQDVNIAEASKTITKFSANIESTAEVQEIMNTAVRKATTGRKGPVVLDVNASIWQKECEFEVFMAKYAAEQTIDKDVLDSAVMGIVKKLSEASKPVLLIGDGLRHAISKARLAEVVHALQIPTLSSRASEDLLLGEDLYFGYIGSHGLRESNAILSQSDLVIAIGNSLTFPRKSESYCKVLQVTPFIRVDIDSARTGERLENTNSYNVDAGKVLEELVKAKTKECLVGIAAQGQWIETCRQIEKEFAGCDSNEVVETLSQYIKKQPEETVYVCDVGNNEFWAAKAFAEANKRSTVLISKTFASLGLALPKAIGAHYATGKRIVCIVGDQGFQYNSQELQFVKQWQIPIQIVLVNDRASGMILDKEEKAFGEFIHVDEFSGYSVPDFGEIAKAYGIHYTQDLREALTITDSPSLFEIKTGRHRLAPELPKGNSMQDMIPKIEKANQ